MTNKLLEKIAQLESFVDINSYEGVLGDYFKSLQEQVSKIKELVEDLPATKIDK